MSESIRNFGERVSEKVVDSLTSVAEKTLPVVRQKNMSAFDTDVAGGGKSAKPETNMAIVWAGANKVEVKNVGYPKMQTPQGVPIDHGVILKVVASGICGSDLHMYRGSMPGTTKGMVFGHEITGSVFEMGTAVERFEIGDMVSVPFNISCGKCDNCNRMLPNACLKANPNMPGSAYGFSMMGGWAGGQAEYVLVPWADRALLKLPKEVAMEKITSLAFLSDIFPTGYNGAVQAGVSAGSLVYVAGAGPVGLCCARSCFLLGAAEVFISDIHPERLALAAKIGCKTIDLNKLSGGKTDSDAIWKEIDRQLPSWKNGPHKMAGLAFVDCAVDCVGFECCGIGNDVGKKIDEQVLNTCFKVVKAGGGVGIPGIYPISDQTAPQADNKLGVFHLQFGQAWNKGLAIGMGQCPVANYHTCLMKSIIHGTVDLTELLNVRLISLDEAPEAYKRFNEGEAVKYVIDPHGLIKQHKATQGGQSSTK